MNNDFLTNLLTSKYPALIEKENSVQRQKSLELLNIRLNNNINVEKFAEILGLSEKEYLEFEFGDLNHEVSEYDALITKSHKYVTEKLLFNHVKVIMKDDFLSFFQLDEGQETDEVKVLYSHEQKINSKTNIYENYIPGLTSFQNLSIHCSDFEISPGALNKNSRPNNKLNEFRIRDRSSESARFTNKSNSLIRGNNRGRYSLV
ncbi:hypothetical protein IGJ74_001832 [Enterococcus sp. AZ009]|uniref:hypothetical protein n=1 Tax=Enterococcus TaxID=1350 RepID=UPI001C484BD5|nr:hypothetical protein [Enterococcus casseliflavus]